MGKEFVVCIYVCIYTYICIYTHIHTHYICMYTHTHNGILAIKKNEIMPFAATWMDLGIIILSEESQTEKDKYMISLICGS